MRAARARRFSNVSGMRKSGLRGTHYMLYSDFMRFLMVLVCIGCLAGCAGKPDAGSSETAAAASSAVTPGLLLDVRSVAEYEEGHVKGSVNVPVNQIETKIAQLAPEKTTTLRVHCASGARSARAATKLKSLGYTNVVDLGSYENAQRFVEGK